MILQVIKLKSKLPEEELLRRAKEREPQFKANPWSDAKILCKKLMSLDSMEVFMFGIRPNHFNLFGNLIWQKVFQRLMKS